MAELEIMCEPLGALGTNCYFVYDKESRDTVIFDPADNFARIEKKVRENKLNIKAVFLTHGHYDHFLAADKVREYYNVKVYIGEDDYELSQSSKQNVSEMFASGVTFKADVKVSDKEPFDIAGIKFRALHTPGHTKGGMCYYFYENGFVISGDTMFNGSYGRYDMPTGNLNELINSLKNIVLRLPDDTIVLPGHGDDTTIGEERIHYPQW